MKILITGGLGNLGLWLTRSFLDAGHNVTVIGRSERVVITHPNYRFLSADITQLNTLFRVIDCYYDSCIHTASFNEHFKDNYAEEALKVNALGTENLCQSLLIHGVGKLVYLSTFHVYGVSQGVVTENSIVSPVNDYGLTHYFAEKYIEKHAKLHRLNYVVFRLTNSYGCPKDLNTDKWYLLVNDICKQAHERKQIKLNSNGKARRDFIWMGDVVAIVQEAITNIEMVNTNYNLSSSNALSVRSVVNIALDAYQKKYSDVINASYNCSDDSSEAFLDVKNDKLMAIYPYNFKNKIFEECLSIFTLLEVEQ